MSDKAVEMVCVTAILIAVLIIAAITGQWWLIWVPVAIIFFVVVL